MGVRRGLGFGLRMHAASHSSIVSSGVPHLHYNEAVDVIIRAERSAV